MTIHLISSDRKYYSNIESKPKNCSTTIGRYFTKLTDTICSVAKVTALFGLIFAPIAQASQTHGFRPYLGRFVHPGLQIARNGTMACDIQPIVETAKLCETNAGKVFGYLQANHPEEIKLPATINGYSIGHGSGRTFFYNIDPRAYQNYKTALQYVEDTFFGPKSPIEESSEATISYILTLHDKLVRGLSNESQFRPGNFRMHPRYFGSEFRLPEYKEKAKLLPKKEALLFEGYLEKLTQQGLISLNSRDELEIWKKVGLTIAPDHTTIQSQMKAFGTRILELIDERINSIDLAAYIHTEIVRITPFVIANGQVARILANAALVRYGSHMPVVFSSKIDYLSVVEKAVAGQNYKLFANYLRDNQIPWTARMEPTLRAVESRYPTRFKEDTALYMKPGFLISPRGNALCPVNEMEATCTKIADGYLQRYKSALSFIEKRVLQNPLAFTDAPITISDIKTLYTTLTEENAEYQTAETAKEMLQFVNQLHLRLETESQFVEIACWAHKELVRIAPFASDNEKLARFVFTALLRRYTPYNHIFFDREDEYERLTKLALKGDLAPFVAYVYRT